MPPKRIKKVPLGINRSQISEKIILLYLSANTAQLVSALQFSFGG